MTTPLPILLRKKGLSNALDKLKTNKLAVAIISVRRNTILVLHSGETSNNQPQEQVRKSHQIKVVAPLELAQEM